MKKIKSIWMRLLVIVISVAMMIGCLSGLVLADETSGSESSPYLHESKPVQSKVALGENFTIPAAKSPAKVIVKDPSGKEVTSNDLTFLASNLGNYTVTYYNEDEDTSYTYTINCYEEAEYFICVENNGAGIPTYIKSGDSFTLPDWYLAKYDDDGNIVRLTATDGVRTEWKLTGETRSETAGAKIAINTLGSQIVTLSAKFDGSNKTYSEEYTIISQTNFEDTKAPTLRNIANMPSSASVKTSVSLPKATAEDNYDENVLITVSVKDPNGNAVKKVEVNDNDYAVKALDEDVEFDNDRVTSFYPMEVGTYVVSYIATDDAGNSSSEHTYKITVSDKTGPVITDVKDDAIPSAWGLKSVTNKDGETKLGEQISIEIPIPEVVDNLDEFNLDVAGDKAWTGDIKMTVEIKNPNVTVARFTSLSPADIKNGKEIDASDATYGKYFKADEAGNDYGVQIKTDKGYPYIRLNFGDFYEEETNDTKTKAAITGNWTITFSFRDAAGNGGYNASQKVYTIDVSDSAFVDDKAPEIEAPTLPDYLILGSDDETYTVPNIVVSDDKDSRLTEEYKIFSNDASIDVEGGEELKIVEDNGKYYFENKDEQRLELGTSIRFAYSAKDDAGNISYLKTKNEEGEEVDYTLNVYTAQDGYDVNKINVELVDAKLEANTSNAQYIGEFKVAEIAQREFVGFELIVKDKDGNSLDGVTSYFFFAKDEDGKESLYVKDIMFNPAESGTYEINVRIFDAKGNSYVYAKKVEAEADDDTTTVGPNNASASWNNVGTTRKSYMLQRKAFTVSGKGDYIRVFKIYGGRYSLLGYEFTPIAQGSYTITEFYAEQSKVLAYKHSDEDKFEDILTQNAIYGMTVTDENSTKFEVDGVIPSYLAKTKTPSNTTKYEDGAYYITDPIIAYSENQNYDLTVTYTNPKGDSNTAQKVYENTKGGEGAKYSFKEEEGYEFYGRFALILDADGTYTISVTANDASGSNRKTYTIKVGDIEAPQFTLDTTAMRATVGDKFSYRAISDFKLGAGEDDADITVTYKLIEPGSSSSEVSAVSGTKSLRDFKNSLKDGVLKLDNEYVFEKSGDYTVEITLKDAAGNKSVQKYTITVSTTTSSTPTSLTMLSTVLIIVGILLILGVIVYLIRFRKRRA